MHSEPVGAADGPPSVIAVSVVRRRDLGFLGKVFWLIVILVIPLVGLFIYFLLDATRT